MANVDVSPADFRELMLGEEPELPDVMRCVFGIQHHEARTYLTLLDRPGSTVEELASELDRDRSNVNRSLSTLREKGLAERERRLLDGGGHVYQYRATPLPEAKELMHETLDAWAAYVHGRIDDFGEESI
jgi:predicted transcriptional regulator